VSHDFSSNCHVGKTTAVRSAPKLGLGEELYQTAAAPFQGQWPDPTQVPIGRIFYGQNYDAANRYLQYQRQYEANHPWMRWVAQPGSCLSS
jgi:hypothetical protein